MESNSIIDVNEMNFEYEVLLYSQNKPVVVFFWAEWSKPCKQLEPILEKLIFEERGNIRLARVDVDGNPNLALKFGVRTLPTLKAFTSMEVVSELIDLQPEARVYDFFNKITPPSPINLALEKADSMLIQKKWQVAENLYADIFQQDPTNPYVQLGLIKAFLGQGKGKEAQNLINKFPASRQYASAEILRPLAEALVIFQSGNLSEENELDATFINCIRLTSRGNFPSALDGLLDILRLNKNYRNGLPRKIIIAVFELMGENDPLTRQYRTELAAILF